jgi:prevent-host-death family protein
MRKVGLFEAKQKLSELVERPSRGERIGITKRGKLAAMVVPAEQDKADLARLFAGLERIRKKVKPHSGITTKDLIAEGCRCIRSCWMHRWPCRGLWTARFTRMRRR